MTTTASKGFIVESFSWVASCVVYEEKLIKYYSLFLQHQKNYDVDDLPIYIYWQHELQSYYCYY